MLTYIFFFFFFFFNDTATTEIYTLSLHDALPICLPVSSRHAATLFPALVFLQVQRSGKSLGHLSSSTPAQVPDTRRSEEHTSELQSRLHLVCRLLLEKKKKKNTILRSVTIRQSDH